MTRLQIELAVPDITPVQSLTGWRREICIELHGNGAARVFVRAVETGSLKAAELQRGILFHRMDPRFADLAACIEAIRPALESLADTAQRVRPNKDNLFVSVIYDRAMWERVQDHIARWGRKQVHEHRLWAGARPKDAFDGAAAMAIEETPRYSTMPAVDP